MDEKISRQEDLLKQESLIMENIQKTIFDKEKERESINENITQFKTQLSSRQTTLNLANKTVEKLTQEIKTLEGLQMKLEEGQTFDSLIEDVSNSISNFETQIEDARNEIENRQKTQAEIEEKIKNKEDEKSSFKAEISTVKQKLSSNKAQIKVLKENIKKNKDKKEKLESELQKLKGEAEKRRCDRQNRP